MDAKETILRNSAAQLTDVDPKLPMQVERMLHDKGDRTIEQFGLDPATAINLGGLLVNIIALAWKIYQQAKENNANAKIDKDAFAREIRVEIKDKTNVPDEVRNRVIEVVVKETLKQDK